MLYVMPLFGGGILLIYPALMQLAFSFTAVLGLVQSSLFRQPWVRDICGIQPLPTKNSPAKVTTYSDTLSKYEAPRGATSIDTMSTTQGSEGVISSFKNKARSLVSQPFAGMKESVKQYQSTTGSARRKHGRTANELREAQLYEERHQQQQAASQQSNKRGVRQ